MSTPRTKLAPSAGATRRGHVRSILAFAAVSILMLGLAAIWTIIAQRQLDASQASEASEHLAAAHKAFTFARTRVQADLQSDCRVMVEDPRLKATLATEGMDAATVADILQDLLKLRGGGFLMVLSPDGKVFAEAGAPELRGVDLSASSVVKKALASSEAAVGSWVLGKRVMDLSTMTIRYGDQLVAFLVVGQAVDDTMLRGVAEETGVHAASVLGGKIVASSSSDADRVLEGIATTPGAFTARFLEVGGHRYLIGAIELEETAQAHRLVLARPLADDASTVATLHWLLFVPPLLVLMAVLFSTFGIRLFRRS